MTDGRTIVRIVERGCRGVEKSLRGVGGEVDRDVGSGGNGACHFDVQRDLAVGAVRVAGEVGAAVNRYCGYLRFGDPQPAKVAGQIAGDRSRRRVR